MDHDFETLARRYVEVCAACGYSVTVIRLAARIAAGTGDRMDEMLRRYIVLAERGCRESEFAKIVVADLDP